MYKCTVRNEWWKSGGQKWKMGKPSTQPANLRFISIYPVPLHLLIFPNRKYHGECYTTTKHHMQKRSHTEYKVCICMYCHRRIQSRNMVCLGIASATRRNTAESPSCTTVHIGPIRISTFSFLFLFLFILVLFLHKCNSPSLHPRWRDPYFP